MPDIEAALSYALAQIGKPYTTWNGRFGPDRFDCSGLVIRSLAVAGVPLPNGIDPDRGWGNSVSLYNWAKDVGGLVSLDQAIQTRGAILIRGKWYGYGPLGDVKFSLGDGRQTGAGSRRTGVATTNVRMGFFQDGFIIPGVQYGSPIPAPPPAVPEEEPMFIASPHRPIPDTSKAVASWSPANPNRVLLQNGASIAGDRPLNANFKPGDDRVWEPPLSPGRKGTGIAETVYLVGDEHAGQPTGKSIILRDDHGDTFIGNWSL